MRHRRCLLLYIMAVLKGNHRTIRGRPLQKALRVVEFETLRLLHPCATMKDELYPVSGLQAKGDAIISPEAKARGIPLHMLGNLRVAGQEYLAQVLDLRLAGMLQLPHELVDGFASCRIGYHTADLYWLAPRL